MIHRVWTKEETQILLGVWEKHNQRQISELFIPTKTPIQVNQKKMQMGLKKPPVWTEEERGLLLEHGANYNQSDLQQKFFPNKRLEQITGMRKYLGIRRRADKKIVDPELN